MHTGRSRFEQATDFSVGLEEEFAILDSDLELTPGFDAAALGGVGGSGPRGVGRR